ncbi:type I-B CRISPR-associated protein Cas7/Cst2/DevR [Candidatus Bathyarchaeota archaeon]|nr:type I-B CRISPR-associated protein Cas7/Cst2/DevR [Candidatus Bathyarchaeota archaeon]
MKVVQISILAKISGNVNADEVIGTRITLKKMYSSQGEVLPFVSARAIKYAIRQGLKEKGYEIDPFIENPEAVEALRLADSGRPDKYIDNDLFGYMVTKGRGEVARKRQAPIAFSYFKALRDTPIKAEFAARFPRSVEKGAAPVPFEVEVAEFVGRLNCLIYDYIGDFTEDKKQLKKENSELNIPDKLNNDERKNRLKSFLEVLLIPSYVLPRRSNSLNIPEYIVALIVLSDKGPLPIYQYLDYDFESNRVKQEKLELMSNRNEFKNIQMLFIDYENSGVQLPINIKKVTVIEAIEEIINSLIGEETKTK